MFFDATIDSKNYTIYKIQREASQTKIFDERMCTQGIKAYSHVPDSVNKINKNGLINERCGFYSFFFFLVAFSS